MIIKKEEIGLSMILIGVLLIVLLFVFSGDGEKVTGNFHVAGNAVNQPGKIASPENATKLEVPVSSEPYKIFNNPQNKMIAYVIFLIIIGAGVILISLSSWKKKDKKLKAVRKKR